MTGNLSPVTQRRVVVNGRWFIPAIFVGFVVFTIAMALLTVSLGKTMRPTLERMQVERQKAQMEREAKARQAGEAKP